MRIAALLGLALSPAFAQNLQLDLAEVGLGGGVYAANCANQYCHGAAGRAAEAPALIGKGWNRERIDQSVRNGIKNTNMPGWEGKLSTEDLQAVVTYVWSLQRRKSAQQRLSPNRESLGHPGRALFFDATRVGNCGACHRVDGWGIAAVPVLAPPAGVSELRAFVARAVVDAETTDGERFPAWRVESADEAVRVYDLSATLPVLRTFRGDQVTLGSGGSWRHAEVLEIYQDEELGLILDFLRQIAARE